VGKIDAKLERGREERPFGGHRISSNKKRRRMSLGGKGPLSSRRKVGKHRGTSTPKKQKRGRRKNREHQTKPKGRGKKQFRLQESAEGRAYEKKATEAGGGLTRRLTSQVEKGKGGTSCQGKSPKSHTGEQQKGRRVPQARKAHRWGGSRKQTKKKDWERKKIPRGEKKTTEH